MRVLANSINKTWTGTPHPSFSLVNHFWTADLSKSFKTEHHIKTKSVRYRWKGKLLAYVWILWMNGSFWCALPINEFPHLHVIQTRSASWKSSFAAIAPPPLYLPALNTHPPTLTQGRAPAQWCHCVGLRIPICQVCGKNLCSEGWKQCVSYPYRTWIQPCKRHQLLRLVNTWFNDFRKVMTPPKVIFISTPRDRVLNS